MNGYIGIDLGTSGVKLLLVRADGKIVSEASESFEVMTPRPGWTEQDPELWWNATLRGLKSLLRGQDRASVKGISFGGQMHGLVALDRDFRVIRPCILWNDGRTESQTKALNEGIGRAKLSEYTGNIAFAGFTAPKLLWLRENEPENFDRIAKILLPKDYLAFRLSGECGTDLSDASGTLLLDVKSRTWSREMCEICGLRGEQLPELRESYEVAGTLNKGIAEELGLSPSVKIIAGAGDNAAAAVGTGSVGAGTCNVSLGTSGTIFLPGQTFTVDGRNALHSFCHADGKWHLMGCILSAASARKWWLENILDSEDYAADDSAAASAETGNLYFLPYLSGERSPHNDVNARGAFLGLSAVTTRGEMSRAVMEGVAFALRDCLEVARSMGIAPRETTLCGGGARSGTWRRIIADVFGIPVRMLETEQGPAYGGAMLAMVGCGEYETVEQAAGKLVRIREIVEPASEAVKAYEEKYKTYTKFYPLLSDVFSHS